MRENTNEPIQNIIIQALREDLDQKDREIESLKRLNREEKERRAWWQTWCWITYALLVLVGLMVRWK